VLLTPRKNPGQVLLLIGNKSLLAAIWIQNFIYEGNKNREQGQENNIMIDKYLSEIQSRSEIITFPKSEWVDIKKRLKYNKIISTVRICKEFNKYKKNNIYKTEWADEVIIISVDKYTTPELIPTWDLMNKVMKNEIINNLKKCSNNIDFIRFKLHSSIHK